MALDIRSSIDIIQSLPKRVAESHKGTYGRFLIVAGSNLYTGAAALMTEAALRSGVGSVVVVCTHLTGHVIRIRCPEAIVIDAPESQGTFDKSAVDIIVNAIKYHNITAVGMGPGMGQIKSADVFYDNIMAFLSSHKLPLLVDADALVPIFHWVKTHGFEDHRIVFTPHPKEFRDMLQDTTPILDEKKSVLMVAKKIQQVIVYKHHATMIGSTEGIWRSPTGNSALATAGSGDVLSGMVGGLMAQGMLSLPAAKLGVYMHGLAGELAADQRGLRSVLARDLCDHISSVFLTL
ncbi:MAG: NAD(P)H-hydrate dehydratase, partial [Candidatus Marinamargulisbacteria bacterium]